MNEEATKEGVKIKDRTKVVTVSYDDRGCDLTVEDDEGRKDLPSKTEASSVSDQEVPRIAGRSESGRRKRSI